MGEENRGTSKSRAVFDSDSEIYADDEVSERRHHHHSSESGHRSSSGSYHHSSESSHHHSGESGHRSSSGSRHHSGESSHHHSSESSHHHSGESGHHRSSSESHHSSSGRKGRSRRKKSGKRRALLIVGVIVLILANIALFAYVAARYFYGKSNYVSDISQTRDENYVEHLKEADENFVLATLESDEERKLASKFEDELERFHGKQEESEAETETEEESEGAAEPTKTNFTTNNTYNILLIGTDKRPEWTYYGNSDVMVLITVNENKKTIYMTSFMRDLYANISRVGVRKLNSAYAIGAGPLLAETISANYGVKIDNYAAVNFDSTAEIIDMFGGVDVEVNSAEASYAGLPTNGDGVLTHLNGTQAVRYARIRHIGNSDYERTSRQREVLTSLLQQIRGSGVTNYLGLMNSILPLTTHNMSMDTVGYIVSKAPAWIGYNLVQLRVPFDGHYTSSNEILIPDIRYTLETLLTTLYGME